MSNVPKGNNAPSISDIGLTSKQIHEARQLQDAEQDDPGLTKRALGQMLQSSEEPTKAKLKREIVTAKRQDNDSRAP